MITYHPKSLISNTLSYLIQIFEQIGIFSYISDRLQFMVISELSLNHFIMRNNKPVTRQNAFAALTPYAACTKHWQLCPQRDRGRVEKADA